MAIYKSALLLAASSAVLVTSGIVSRYDACPTSDQLPLDVAITDMVIPDVPNLKNECGDTKAEHGDPPCSCLIDGVVDAYSGDAVHCKTFCYFPDPVIGDPCPLEEAQQNMKWNVISTCTNGAYGCFVTSVTHPVVKYDKKFNDLVDIAPAERPLDITCGNPAPVTHAPVTHVPVTHAPVTHVPVTYAPVTHAPVTYAPVTHAPVTYAPVTHAPVTYAPVKHAHKTCDHYAYDDARFCKCPAPKQVGDVYEVSVCGDATYELPAGVIPCSGPITEDAAGTGCPAKGSVAKSDCEDEHGNFRTQILSYIYGKNKCIAPEQATCEKLSTGAWGCVFPGNCNTQNECLAKNIVNPDHYKTDEQGEAVMGENGYPVPQESYDLPVNTSTLPKLTYSPYIGDEDSAGSVLTTTAITMLTAFTATFMLL